MTHTPSTLFSENFGPYHKNDMVGYTGVEPVTSPLSGVRSNQLS